MIIAARLGVDYDEKSASLVEQADFKHAKTGRKQRKKRRLKLLMLLEF